MAVHDGDVGDESFDRLVSILNYTMFVVTTQAGGHPSGCLVGFATQTSLAPQRFLVGLSRRNHTFKVARQSNHLAVHIVARSNVEVARLFGSQTGDNVDKFKQCSWHSGPAGMPILDDAAAWFVGKTLSRIDVGDHMAYLLEPIAAHISDDSGELVVFSDVVDLEPGHDA